LLQAQNVVLGLIADEQEHHTLLKNTLQRHGIDWVEENEVKQNLITRKATNQTETTPPLNYERIQTTWANVEISVRSVPAPDTIINNPSSGLKVLQEACNDMGAVFMNVMWNLWDQESNMRMANTPNPLINAVMDRLGQVRTQMEVLTQEHNFLQALVASEPLRGVQEPADDLEMTDVDPGIGPDGSDHRQTIPAGAELRRSPSPMAGLSRLVPDSSVTMSRASNVAADLTEGKDPDKDHQMVDDADYDMGLDDEFESDRSQSSDENFQNWLENILMGDGELARM
jgi:hypothetical protein